jgi:hypothetical protein
LIAPSAPYDAPFLAEFQLNGIAVSAVWGIRKGSPGDKGRAASPRAAGTPKEDDLALILQIGCFFFKVEFIPANWKLGKKLLAGKSALGYLWKRSS